MKLPNSYGSVIKLGGKRRKPYAVRISKLVEDDTRKVKRKYTYLAYFSKPEMAYTYLAEYNSGAIVPENMKYSDSPTFAEMYENTERTLYAIIACMMAYYKDEEKFPVKDKDIMDEATPVEFGTAMLTILNMRSEFYNVPKGEEEKPNKGKGKGKNA